MSISPLANCESRVAEEDATNKGSLSSPSTAFAMAFAISGSTPVQVTTPSLSVHVDIPPALKLAPTLSTPLCLMTSTSEIPSGSGKMVTPLSRVHALMLPLADELAITSSTSLRRWTEPSGIPGA